MTELILRQICETLIQICAELKRMNDNNERIMSTIAKGDEKK